MVQDNCGCVSPESGDMPNNVIPVTPSTMQRSLLKYAQLVKDNYETYKKTHSKDAFKSNIPLFIYGAPGIGKTEIVNQVGKQLGMKVFTFIASTMDPSDVRGIPVANAQGGYSQWLPPRDFKKDEGRAPAIFFFDELNLATADVRAAFYQLILSGVLEDIDISNSLRIGAGNNKGLVPELRNAWLGTPLATRFNIYWMLPDLTSWLSYAREKLPDGMQRVDPIVVDFIVNPDLRGSPEPAQDVLYCVNPRLDCIGRNNATPRGWVKVSDMIRHGITDQSDISAAVGTNWGLLFANYYKTLETRKPSTKIKPIHEADNDPEYWKNLPNSDWQESFNLSMNNYFSPLKDQIAKGTYTDNVAYKFDESTYQLTVDQEIMNACINTWSHMLYAPPEVSIFLSKKEGFNFIAYLSSLSNPASRLRDKILFIVISREHPDYAPVFGTYEAFIIGHPFEGYSVDNATGAKYKSLKELEDSLIAQGYKII